MKVCRECGEARENSDYHKNRLVCKGCVHRKNKAYREANKAALKIKQAAYMAKHEPERKSYQKRYYVDNKEKLAAQNKEYRLTHLAELAEYGRQYRKDNEPRLKEWRQGRLNEDRATAKARTRKLRDAVLEHYGHRCSCCGETEREFLAIDHVNGGGNKHRRSIKVSSGVGFARWLIKNNFPDGFRLLCHNCNLARGIYGYCPHEKVQIRTDEAVAV